MKYWAPITMWSGCFIVNVTFYDMKNQEKTNNHQTSF